MIGELPIQGRWREGDEDQLLTVGEVCDAMRVSNMTVYRLIKSGDLPGIRFGKTYLVLESEVEGYFSGLRVMVEAEEMAKTLVGLDIGSTAVRAAEVATGDVPVLSR